MNFGGKDSKEEGPEVDVGSTLSGKRVDAHTPEVTDKTKFKVLPSAAHSR